MSLATDLRKASRLYVSPNPRITDARRAMREAARMLEQQQHALAAAREALEHAELTALTREHKAIYTAALALLKGEQSNA